MNSSSIVNFAGKGVEQMTWNDIVTLYKEGHQIGAHTMNHLRNMTNMPISELQRGPSNRCPHHEPSAKYDQYANQRIGL